MGIRCLKVNWGKKKKFQVNPVRLSCLMRKDNRVNLEIFFYTYLNTHLFRDNYHNDPVVSSLTDLVVNDDSFLNKWEFVWVPTCESYRLLVEGEWLPVASKVSVSGL